MTCKLRRPVTISSPPIPGVGGVWKFQLVEPRNHEISCVRWEERESKMKRFIMYCLPVLALLILTSTVPVFAAATGNLAISANVVSACTVGAGTLDFGAYAPLAGGDLDVQGAVKYTCTKNTVITSIALGPGANASGTTRRMKDAGTNYLTYELYSDSTRTTVWSAVNTVGPITVPNKNEQTQNVYGRITAGQDVPSGTYTDTVLVTLNF